MKHFLQKIAVTLGLGSKTISTPTEFTEEFAQAFRQAAPDYKVEILQDFQVKISTSDEHTATAFLQNAYQLYQQSPAEKAAIFERFIGTNMETITAMGEKISVEQIVPVVKDREWLVEIRKNLEARQGKEIPEYIHEALNPELIVLYAQDSPRAIRYLTPDDVLELKLEPSQLRTLAVENLKRLLTKVECQENNGVYLFAAGGDYEASLLLFDGLWTRQQMPVPGEIVVAIPVRGLLLATGSENKPGLQVIREVAKKAQAEGAYPLSSELFVRRGENWEVFAA